MELICDIDYMGDGKPCHFMDIYRPRNYEGKLPVMFNLHGGGFLLGKKEEGFSSLLYLRETLEKSSFYPYINETCSDADNRIIKTKDALCFSGSGQFLLHY